MADNVQFNGRGAVHAGSNGTLNTIDVCLTPSGNSMVPIPYANVARSADADKTAGSVFGQGNPLCHNKSEFSKSTGDQPGRRKGVASGTIEGKATFLTASTNIYNEGNPAVRSMDMMVSNNRNTPPAPLMQDLGLPALPTPVQALEALEPTGPDRLPVRIRGASGIGLDWLTGETDA